MDKMREEFEAWFNGEYGYFPWRSKFDGDDYATTLASSTWEGWKASRAALCVELPASCDAGGLHCDCEVYEAALVNDLLREAGVSHK